MIMTLTYHWRRRGQSAHKSRKTAGVRPFLFLIFVRAINFTAEGFTRVCLLLLGSKTTGARNPGPGGVLPFQTGRSPNCGHKTGKEL